jgi:hypothetical protein
MKKKKKKKKSIISPKIDKLVRDVVEDEEDDMLEETVKVVIEGEKPVDNLTP